MKDSKKISVVFVPHYVHKALKLNGQSLEGLIPHGITELDFDRDGYELYSEKVKNIYMNIKNISKLDILDFIVFNKGCNNLLETSKSSYSWSLLDYELDSKLDIWTENLNKDSSGWEDTFEKIMDELGYSESDDKYSIVVTQNILYVVGNPGFKSELKDSKKMISDILESIDKYYGREEALKSFAFTKAITQ